MDIKRFIPEFRPFQNFTPVYQFTVFVPVFNGSETLYRIFDSLNAQTFRNFEVIIINDGSTDNSHQIISGLLHTANFEVTYINNKRNKHKLGCRLEAVKIAKGEFFLALDCDDECTADALEVFNKEYLDIPDEIKSKISGVSCCCIDQNGKLIGDYFPEDPFFKNSFEKKINYNIKGEKWGFNKTQILKSITINEDVFGRGLIPESFLWFLIAREGYITKYINRTLRIYYTGSYSSLSTLGYEKKAFGMAIFALAFINWFHKEYLFKAMKHFLVRLYSLLKASKYLDFKLKDYVNALDNYFLKMIFVILWPLRKVI